MKKAFALTILLLLSHWAIADCRPNGTPEMVAQTKESMLNDPDYTVTEKGEDFEQVFIRKEDGSLVIGSFTLSEHGAHPSVVVSAVYESEGKVWVYHRGLTAGDCVVFERWLETFAERDRELQQRFGQGGS